MDHSSEHVIETASRWLRDGQRLALAVVTGTWGSSPRQPGSLMAIRGDGQVAGSVSGGCVEASVIDSGLRLIEEGGAEAMEFGVADETAWSVGLPCGGRIAVFVCPDRSIGDGLIEAAAEAIGKRQPARVDCLIREEAIVAASGGAEANSMDGDGARFRLDIAPRPRLVIIGAVHISQHLAPMALSAGLDVTVIDPRTAFANEERFPGVELVTEWPDEALKGVALDERTAVVTLTHDPKIDDSALAAVLPHPVFHIASLGSTRSHAARCGRLKEMGIGKKDIERIHGPAGIAIGAKTPAEIAVSILAGVIADLRGPKGSGE